MTKQVVVHGLDRVLKKLDVDLYAKPLGEFFKKISIEVQGKARGNAPVDQGHLRNAIAYEVDSSKPPLWAKVGLTKASPGSPLWYKGRAMEYGTGRQGDSEVSHKSGHWPPGQALAIWARRHGGGSGFAVAAGIGKRGGLRPRRYLRDALEDSMGKIKSLLNDFANDVARNWDR